MELFPLLDIPTDLLVVVLFSWLDTISSVQLDTSFCCRDLRPAFLSMISSDQCVLPVFPIEELYKESMDDALRWATCRLVKCRTLFIWSDIPFDALDNYLSENGNLVNVHLEDMNNIGHACLLIAKYCHSSNLYFCGCTFSSSVQDIFQCSVCLKEIYIFQCTNITAEAFIVVFCPNLETLALFQCNCDDQCILAAVQMSDRVHNLNIGENDFVTDLAVRDAVAEHPGLQRLVLSALYIVDDTVIALAAACAQLLAIDLCFCENLTDAAIVAVATECKHLVQLLLPDCGMETTKSLLAIAHNCAGLKWLRAGQFDGATEQDEMHLLDSCSRLDMLAIHFSSAQVVAHLPVSVTTLDLPASSSTDDVLLAVSRRCKNLTSLRICCTESSQAYTARGLAAITKACTQLRKLVLDKDTEQTTELALQLWRDRCPNLEIRDHANWWELEVFPPAASAHVK